MKLAICGSMQFSRDMLAAKEYLETRGHAVQVPLGAKEYASGEKLIEDKWEKLERDVIREWYKVIASSDAVLVLNYDKGGVPGYVGGNALIEMAFAHVLRKRIFLLNPVPDMSYRDEIEAFRPEVLDGDVGRIS